MGVETNSEELWFRTGRVAESGWAGPETFPPVGLIRSSGLQGGCQPYMMLFSRRGGIMAVQSTSIVY